MVTPAAKREAVAHVRSAFELSERRACRMICCVRMTVRYCSRRPPDTELHGRLKALAHERRRFGDRRLLVLLAPGGLHCESQAAVSDLSRGTAHGPPTRWAQTSLGNTRADA